MPGQKSRDKAPVHVSIRKDRIDAARARLVAENHTMTDLIDFALSEYVAGRLNLGCHDGD